MSTKNNKNIASQALLEMDSITSAIKEESKKALGSLLSEAVKGALREGCCDEDDKNDEDDYEVVDSKEDDSADKSEDEDTKSGNVSEEGEEDEPQGNMNPQNPQAQAEPQGQVPQEAPNTEEPAEAPAEEPAEEGEGEEGMDDFSEYKVGDDTYDLSGEKDYNKVARVFKLLSDDDKVVVKNDGDKITLKDNEAGTEYLIDLGAGEGEETSEEVPEEGQGELNEEDIAGFPDDEEDDFGGYDPDSDADLYPQDEADGFFNDGLPDGVNPDGEYSEDEGDDFDEEDEFGGEDEFGEEDNNLYESKKTKKPMKESKEVLFEVDLGYTDSYQDKDPISGLSDAEPSKSGKSWEKGVPTGTSKPWAGETKSKGTPFSKTQKVAGSVDEEDMPQEPAEMGGEQPVDEAATSKNRRDRRHTTKTNSKAIGDSAYNPEVTKVDNGKLEESIKKIKAENKALKEAVVALKKNLQEAYLTNVNLGKITKLFVENTTSQSEKVDIVNRFCNEAKTIEQSKNLYESINKQLKKSSKSVNINESSKTAKGTKVINESKTYQSESLMKTINLMNRVNNLY